MWGTEFAGTRGFKGSFFFLSFFKSDFIMLIFGTGGLKELKRIQPDQSEIELSGTGHFGRVK